MYITKYLTQNLHTLSKLSQNPINKAKQNPLPKKQNSFQKNYSFPLSLPITQNKAKNITYHTQKNTYGERSYSDNPYKK